MGSIVETCDAFEQNRVVWSYELYLHLMRKHMAMRGFIDAYRPTYIKLAEVNGAPIKTPPWIKVEDSFTYAFPGPRCIWPGPAK